MSLKDDDKPSFFKNLFSGLNKVTQEKRSVFSMKASMVVIRVNGKEQRFDTSSNLDEAALRQFASQAGVTLDNILNLLRSNGVTSIDDLLSASQTTQSTQQKMQSSQSEPLHGRVTLTECTKCHRKVPASDHCLYCGQSLPITVDSKETTNEVDKKFLEADVVEENKTKEKQQIRDTFEDRLKNL